MNTRVKKDVSKSKVKSRKSSTKKYYCIWVGIKKPYKVHGNDLPSPRDSRAEYKTAKGEGVWTSRERAVKYLLYLLELDSTPDVFIKEYRGKVYPIPKVI